MISLFRSKIRTRHPSHSILRTKLPLLPFKSIVRLGSTTGAEDTLDKGGNRIECNSIQAIKNSSSKALMKECFKKAGIMTANYTNNVANIEAITDNWVNGLVAKSHYGSRGEGNTLIKTKEEFDQWSKGKTLSHYIFEQFYNYALEFRLHVTEEGYFYACRKALKKDCPEHLKWRHHDDTCVWYTENNADFKKPNSWDHIVTDCVKALKAIGADVLSFDVKVQGESSKEGKKREYQDYILIECNSASSFGDITAEKYLEEIPKILKRKYLESKK